MIQRLLRQSEVGGMPVSSPYPRRKTLPSVPALLARVMLRARWDAAGEGQGWEHLTKLPWPTAHLSVSPQCPCSSDSFPYRRRRTFPAVFSSCCCLSSPHVFRACSSGREVKVSGSPWWGAPAPGPATRAPCPGDKPSLRLLPQLLCGECHREQ